MKFENKIFISEIIKEKIPGLQLGILEVNAFRVEKKSPLVQEAFVELEQFIKSKFAGSPPSSDPIVSATRRMYRRIGWEPTRYRPSSEAMIRRFLKNKGLYNINNAVDLGNVASTRFHLPMGLYDMNKIDSSITFDVGGADETYQGLSVDIIHAEGKLILRDKTGIFGNPTADSRRTCIDMDTTEILVIFFAAPEVEKDYVQTTLNFLSDLYKKDCSSAEIENYILV